MPTSGERAKGSPEQGEDPPPKRDEIEQRAAKDWHGHSARQDLELQRHGVIIPRIFPGHGNDTHPPPALEAGAGARQRPYLQRLSYGGKVAGRSFGVDPFASGGFDVTKVGALLEAVHLRQSSVTIERLPWKRFIETYDRPGMLFYLDPPYFGSEGDYGKDLFDRSQFAEMAAALSGLQGDFLLSINDHPKIRETFSAFAMEAVPVIYSIGPENDHAASELVISSIAQPRLGELLV